MKHIVLTGGGSAGHVTPNMALIEELKREDYQVSYIGSLDGIESQLIPDMDVPYYGISSGKLRRYLSLKNLTDPFRVIKGIGDAKKILKELHPDLVFSKGGFVSVPVVSAAASLKIPIIVHESDMTPGLANKLSLSHAAAVCCNFPETVDYLPKDKAVMTGTPIRKELLYGNPVMGKIFCGFKDDKPVIMCMGGSLGSVILNDTLRQALPTLLKDFNIIHLCGKGKTDDSLMNTEGYRQYEYIKKELPDLFALSSLLISRAGANAIAEIASLAKPNLLIPLSAKASRGDQELNAASYEKQGFSMVLEEEDITDEIFTEKVYSLYENRQKYIDAMSNSVNIDSTAKIMELIHKYQLKD